MYTVRMSKKEVSIASFLKELMHRRKRLLSQLAADLGVSHVTVGRWLSGKDVPSTRSCLRLADYSGVSIQKILTIAGHLPGRLEKVSADLPEFRDYARKKYPKILDDDLVIMIEDLIERRRQKRHGRKNH